MLRYCFYHSSGRLNNFVYHQTFIFLYLFSGCQERRQLNDTNYSASPSAVQLPKFARLDTSNPGLSKRAWCADPGVFGSYLQIDLGMQ